MTSLRFSVIVAALLALAAMVLPYGSMAPDSARAAAVRPAQQPAAQLTPSPTPDPYAGLTIAELAARTYGGGELKIEKTLAQKTAFTRYLISYPSDGLTIYGFMDVPTGTGLFPVILVLHGYVSPVNYQTLTYTTHYADALAEAGYLTIHPNYRGYPPSDTGSRPNLFRVGFAVDVLNLVALVKQHGGQTGPLEKANPQAIGLLGHSMGGGIGLRVITVDPGVKAAVLYGAMSGDEKANAERLMTWSGGQRGKDELAAPDTIVKLVSPSNYLDRIKSAISIHHGESDQTVPPQWSSILFSQLQGLHKTVEYFTYPGQPHTFKGEADQLFIKRSMAFFDRQLKNKQ
jgi:uncharacterized protein